MGIRKWIYKKLHSVSSKFATEDSTSRDLEASKVKRVGLRLGDVTSKDFEDPEFDLSEINAGYIGDSYIRQGVDKYVDQLFKGGYELYSKNEQAAQYIRLRLSFIAESTQTPTDVLLSDIAEDVVKYSNCFVAKVRANDPAMLPPGVTITGLNDKDPIAGYFCINATMVKIKRDKVGVVNGYQQEDEGGSTTVKFKPEDIIHFFYKKEKGNAFGTPFLWPVLDDVRALRQSEENVLKMMHRNIHPFYHVAVGSEESPATDQEIDKVESQLNSMEVNGGIVTSERVKILPIASDAVINAEPYLAYLENRIFSGMGIPAILFGRGDTSNRSTGDNMTSEMADRIKAIQKNIEATINEFLIKELLLEGGYDPIMNPDDLVEFRFKENDMDSMIKFENHVIYKFEHNVITEDETRALLNLDPIQDRSLLYRELTAQTEIAVANATANNGTSSASSGSSSKSTKEGDNKNKPTNQYGTKSSPKKTSASLNEQDLETVDYLLKGEIYEDN